MISVSSSISGTSVEEWFPFPFLRWAYAKRFSTDAFGENFRFKSLYQSFLARTLGLIFKIIESSFPELEFKEYLVDFVRISSNLFAYF